MRVRRRLMVAPSTPQLPATPVVSSDPNLVQFMGKSMAIFTGGEWSNNGFATLPLPNGSQGGNLLVVFVRVTSNRASSDFQVTDDKSNTWSAVSTVAYNATGDATLLAYYAANVAADTRILSVKNVSGAARDDHMLSAAEFYNVASVSVLDTSAGSSGNSSTVNSGSVTPTATNSGSLVVMAAARTETPFSTSSFTVGSQSNIAWKALYTNRLKGFMMQWGVYGDVAALNPTLTMGTSGQYVALGLVFKRGTSGNPRSAGMRVVGLMGLDFRPGDFTDPLTIQMPSYGNLRVIAQVGGVAPNVATIVDVTETGGATWATCGTGIINDSIVGMWYGRAGSEHHDNAVTLDFDNSLGDFTLQCYDVIAANANPLDQSATASGNQGTSSSTITTVTGLTPTTRNGLLICAAGVAFGTLSGNTAPTGALFDSSFYDGQSNDGPSTPDENNGWCHYYNPDLSAVTFTFSKRIAGSSFNWAAMATAFKAA